jgi:hypothetical protein
MISYFLQAAALGASTQKAPNERKAASVTLRKARHRFLGISWEMWQMMKKMGRDLMTPFFHGDVDDVFVC